MRKPSRQGVPKRKVRDMAKPMAEAGKTKDAPQIAPRVLAPEPEMSVDPEVLLAPTLPPELASELEPEPEPAPIAQPEPEPGPKPEPAAVAEAEPEPEPEAAAVAEPEPVVAPEPEPMMAAESAPEPEPAPEEAAPAVDPDAPPLTMREMFARVEPAFQAFRTAAYRYPAEHMNDRIGDGGWTRKQMLAHVAAWHDLTTDRLIKAGMTGQPVMLDREQEQINAAAARVAIGKTAGEVLKDVESTYARLRRQMLRMTDTDLRLGEGWAAERIAGNTYHHYAEHMADLVPPSPLAGSGAQR
ncbi:MAG: hypothetical protein QOJ81_866 [Chloroflexota bacterium]|nr:hypothetical protein [Chloroflexota bacterium]